VNLPPLADLSYAHGDVGDHPGGGHCLSIDRDSSDGWFELLDQYYRALSSEIEASSRDENGWARTLPVIYYAHHTCEVALKAAICHWTATTAKGHGLRVLYDQLAGIPGADQRVTEEAQWIDRFLAEMEKLTVDGSSLRYPDARDDPSVELCCVNLMRLGHAVGAFVTLVLPDRGEVTDRY